MDDVKSIPVAPTAPAKAPAPDTVPHAAAQIAKLTPAQRAKVEDALCAAVANGATDKRIATVSLALVSAIAMLNDSATSQSLAGANDSGARPSIINVTNELGVPALTAKLAGSSATGVLSLIQTIIEYCDLERMANLEGRTFNDPDAKGQGPALVRKAATPDGGAQ